MTLRGKMSIKKKFFVKQIIIWGKINRRQFEWRKTNNPFHILIAELLLQRTAARQVEPVYGKIIEKYPSPAALANAELEDLYLMLKPLGLAYRAGRLIEISKVLEKEFEGNVPQNEKELLSLNGIGKYAANAVLSFAYGKDVGIVDTNILRVISRYFSVYTPLGSHKKLQIWNFVNALIPQGESRDFNLSMLDFSNLVCKTKEPMHEVCPIKSYCSFYANLQEKFKAV